MKNKRFFTLAGLMLASAVHAAGPFPPAAGQPGSTAVGKDDPGFVGWATAYRDYLPGPNVDSTWKTPERALGKAIGTSFDIVSLGDSGRITLSFGASIFNGPGADFAIFENSFSDTFLELAWVEVSSDGSDFFRFPGVSLTSKPVGGFGNVDPTNIDGFAGKYRQGFGTPFDLQDLAPVQGLDINNVRYVRIVDIVGDGSVLDVLGNKVFDPYPTTGSGGFDLDAVGVFHLAPAVPEPESWLLLACGLLVIPFAARIRGRVDPQEA